MQQIFVYWFCILQIYWIFLLVLTVFYWVFRVYIGGKVIGIVVGAKVTAVGTKVIVVDFCTNLNYFGTDLMLYMDVKFIKCFFCIYWDDHKIFILYFAMWCIKLTDLQMLNHPSTPRIDPIWSQYTILLMYCWVWFADILLRNFASMFISDIGL